MGEARGPELELDWEEGVFRLVRGLARRLLRRPPERPPGEVLLLPLVPRLGALASLVAGRPLRVLPARARGGVRGDELLLPPAICTAPDIEGNVLLYVTRAILAGQLAAGGPGEGEPAVRAAVEVLTAEYPGFGALWERARAIEGGELVDSLLWGPELERPAPSEGAGPGDERRSVEAEATEIDAPAVDDLILHRLEEEPRELPVHSFEKVEMAESFGGTFRRPDGSDELDAQLEALNEVDLGHLLRGGPSAGSLLKADLSFEADVPSVQDIGSDEACLRYDEWDGRAGRYRRGWCRVYPTDLPRGGGRWAAEALARHRRTVERLHGQLLRHRDRLRARPRCASGDDIDVDAVCESWATLRAGHTPSPRLYVQQARERRDLATIVLLDVSLSTDAWVANRRVLDVARESVLVLGEVADRLGDDLAVLAFASHTRHKVRCWSVRDWGEPWALGRSRLGLLEPQGYTRIGPALRHATAQLALTSARRKLLILVSDCKPTDYDRYEGRHGVADVRKALAEAHRDGVRVQALAVDAVATRWLPAMFGAGRWSVLPRPELLPEALTQAYGRAS